MTSPISSAIEALTKELLPCVLGHDEHLFEGDATIHPRSCAASFRPAVSRALQDAEDRTTDQAATIAELQAENSILRKGVEAAAGLINDSDGVYGLHLNGNPVPWDELMTGGRYESWLIDLDAAAAALTQGEG